MNVLSATEMYSQIVKIVCFILCDFYHSKKKKKEKRLGPNLDIPDPLFQVLQVSPSC